MSEGKQTLAEAMPPVPPAADDLREAIERFKPLPPIVVKTTLPLRDIETEPKGGVALTLSRQLQQTLALLTGWDGQGRRRLRCDSEGQLYVRDRVTEQWLTSAYSIGTIGAGFTPWQAFNPATRHAAWSFRHDGIIQLDTDGDHAEDYELSATQQASPWLKVDPAWEWRGSAYLPGVEISSVNVREIG